MQQQRPSNQAFTDSSALGQLLRILGVSHHSSPPRELPAGDCIVETDDEMTRSGGYNDAFIVQYWTSYNPRH